PGRDQGGEQRAGGERFVVGVRVDGEDGRGVLEQLPRRGDRHGGVAGEGGVGGHEAAPGAVWRAVTVVYRLARASAALSQVRVAANSRAERTAARSRSSSCSSDCSASAQTSGSRLSSTSP